MESLREKVFEHVKEKYKTEIEYLWFRYPNYAVFRNNQNKKWYGLIMDIPYQKLGLNKEGIVDVLNVKVSDMMLKEFLIQQEGIFNGYHISRGNWISILLDGTISLEQVLGFLDESYLLTNKTFKRVRKDKR